MIWHWVLRKGGNKVAHINSHARVFVPFFFLCFPWVSPQFIPFPCQRERDFEWKKMKKKKLSSSLWFFTSLLSWISMKGVCKRFLLSFFLKKMIRSKSKKQDLQVAGILMVSEVFDRHHLRMATYRG